MRERTVGTDPLIYCPGGKSQAFPGAVVPFPTRCPGFLWPGRLESASPRGRGRVRSNKIRFQMSSALDAGVPPSDSRIRCRVRSAKVCLRISSISTGEGMAISSNSPPGVSIRTMRPLLIFWLSHLREIAVGRVPGGYVLAVDGGPSASSRTNPGRGGPGAALLLVGVGSAGFRTVGAYSYRRPGIV